MIVVAPPAMATLLIPAAAQGEREGFLRSAGHEVEGGAALHLERVALDMGEHVHRGVVRRSGPHQPARVGIPRTTAGTDVFRSMMYAPAPRDHGDLVAVLVGALEHPRVERPLVDAITERPIEGLVGSGGVAVERDRDVACDDAHISRTALRQRELVWVGRDRASAGGVGTAARPTR